MHAIEIRNLTKSYGRARGIVNLSLTVAEGECFGFIGPNGAGKSTTIRTLLGFIKPTGGSAAVFGKEITSDPSAIRRDCGYLPSEAAFYPGMKVRDILKLSADLRGENCTEEAGRLCEHLQLDVTRRAEDLSFGNRKKVAIVCALQHRPKLLILDEPTGGLDPLMQHAFFEIIRERNAQGVTVFLSSHILSEIEHNCTRAAIIREGQVVACDSVEALAGKKTKRISVRTENPGALREAVSALSGVPEEAVVEGGVLRFMYRGDINELLRLLSSHTVQDVTIAEPELEEIFMDFYA